MEHSVVRLYIPNINLKIKDMKTEGNQQHISCAFL